MQRRKGWKDEESVTILLLTLRLRVESLILSKIESEPMNENEISKAIVDAAIEVHRTLGVSLD